MFVRFAVVSGLCLALTTTGCGADEDRCEQTQFWQHESPYVLPGSTGIYACGLAEGPRNYVRREAVACPAPDGPLSCNEFEPEWNQCLSDADCTESRGTCSDRYEWCQCIKGCLSDDDCGPTGACVCDVRPMEPESGRVEGRSRCILAECRTGEDCPSGVCGLEVDACGEAIGYFCHTSNDECDEQRFCEGGWEVTCAYDRDDRRWVCAEYSGTCAD